jgi:transposase
LAAIRGCEYRSTIARPMSPIKASTVDSVTPFSASGISRSRIAPHYAHRRRREFLDFMNEIVAANPGRETHVIVDNLNTPKPKRDRWLQRHPQVQLHFTPTYSSWLNQVECWFSILSRSALRNADAALLDGPRPWFANSPEARLRGVMQASTSALGTAGCRSCARHAPPHQNRSFNAKVNCRCP